MRVINNSSYNFKFYQDQYILIDKLNTDVTYTLYYIQEGKTDVVVETKLILGTATIEEKTLILPVNKDGRYRLSFTEINDQYKHVYFTHSLGKRDLIIRGLKKAICRDCQCKEECNGCMTREAKQCIANQSLFTLVSHYLYVNKDFSIVGYPSVSNTTYLWYKEIFNNKYDYLNCEISKQCLENTISGSSSINQDVFAYYMAIYYMGWYLEAKQEIDLLDTDALEQLNKVYNYKKLSDCVAKLGINIEDITDDFNVQPINVFYWQLGQFETFVDLQNLFNPLYLYAKPFQLFSVFEAGYNVPKNSIGKLCFAISPTINQPFLIQDSLGNDVTDNFETFYDASLQAVVYCSILVYTSGTLFFKFKTI